MHADYLSVTMTEDSYELVMSEVMPLLGTLGIAGAHEGLMKLINGGSLKMGATRGGVHHVSGSGAFLDALRAHNLYQNYLHILGSVPHRVTRLDVAHDVYCDSPRVLKRLQRRAYKGDIQLTRKKIDPHTQVKNIMGLDREGRSTGTLYLGPPKPQVVSAKIYDKRHERWSRAGKDIPATLRYELKLGRKAHVSLRDAWEPDPVFWHYMSDLLPAPEGVPQWTPHGEGFHLPPGIEVLPAQSLKRLVETSDLADRMISLADRIGPNGFDYLLRLLGDKRDRATINITDQDKSA